MIRRAVLSLAAAGLTACQHDVLPAVAPAPVAACLTFAVQERGVLANAYDRDVQNAVRSTTETALVGAGFNVLDDASQPHDLVATITTVPGSRLESNARVQTKISLESGGKVVATLDASAPQEGSGYGGEIADQLVDAVFRSPDLAAFTRALRQPKSKQHLATAALRGAQAPAPTPIVAALPVVPVAAPALVAPAAPSVAEPIVGAPQPDAYALVFGVEAYDHLGAVAGAQADAQRFATLAQRTLGVPKDHIKLVVGDKADKLAFDLNVEWLKLNARQGRIYFYFSGRGSLRRKTATEFLLPKDGDPAALDTTGVSLPALLQALGQTRAKDVIAVIDASFSGAGERSAQAADAVSPKVINDPEIALRVAMLSAVTSAEVAGSTPSGGGLLTRWIVEGLGNARADLDGDGQITLQELATWTGPRVTREAKRGNRSQAPALLLGPGFVAATTTIASGLPAEQ